MSDRNVIERDRAAEEKASRRPQPFSAFEQTPNLILLGDPGAGKTHLFHEAASSSGGQYLTARTFLNVPELPAGTALFIDALDERRAGRGDLDTIDRIVQKLFAVKPAKVRISCRAQDWLGNTDLEAFRLYFEAHGGVVELSLEALSNEEKLVVLLSQGATTAEARALLVEADQRGLREFTLNPQNLIMLAQAVEDGQWPTTRKELFELSSQLLLSEENRVRMRSGVGVFSSEELRDTAGAICAVRLISDVAGVSLREGGDSPDFPSYRSLHFLNPDKAAAALQRRVFVAEPESETVDYTHRTVAEYLAARWIARQVMGGLSIGRVRALLGTDGHPAIELRGLHAWLAVLLPQFAECLIEADPYGVITYADAAALRPSHRKHLLGALGRLAARDPRFRRETGKSPALGMLARPDLVEAFREVLASETSNFSLRTVVIDAVALGPPLIELLPDLIAVLEEESRSYAERQGAATALERFGTSGRSALVAFVRAANRDGVSLLRLRAYIISHLYGTDCTSSDVVALLMDAHASAADLAGGAFWLLDRAIYCADIPSILDSLRPLTLAEHAETDRRTLWEVAATVERLIAKYLREFPGEFSGEQVWNWLHLRRSLRANSSIGFGNEISVELGNRPTLLRSIAEASFEALPRNANSTSFYRWFMEATLDTISQEALTRWLVDYLPRAGYGSERQGVLYELALWLCMSDAPWCIDSFEALTALADGRPDLGALRARYISMEIPDWERKRALENAAEKPARQKNRENARRDFATNVVGVRSGEDRNRLTGAALIYFGDFQDVDTTLEPAQRLVQTLGADNAAIAREGFVAMLSRSYLPSLGEVAAVAAQLQSHNWWKSLLVGMELAWSTAHDLRAFDAELLRKMLVIHLAIPVHGRFDDPVDGDGRGWARALLTDLPDLARDALLAVARASFAAEKDHIVGLHELLHEPSLTCLRDEVVFVLLREYPSAAVGPLGRLLDHSVTVPERREEFSQLARNACNTLTTVDLRDVWLVAGYLVASSKFQAEIEARAAADSGIIWTLRDMAGHDRWHGAPLSLSIEQLEFLTRLSGSIFPEAALPDQEFWGKQNAWDAAQFVHGLIDQLSSSTLSTAGEALARLSADGRLLSYRDSILHAQAEQGARRREFEYRQPDWRAACDVLSNGAPTNAGDFCALVAAKLVDLKPQIESANTDIYKQYWNVDSYGRMTTERPEEICRDALLTLLRPGLFPFGATAEPEGHMAADRRADIAVFAPGMKVVVELKRDSHADVWHAAETQLDRFYTRDPDTAGFGIYGVFWFGAKRQGTLSPSPNVVVPSTAAAMEEGLRFST